MNGQRAFTFIELVVVILVIGLLFALVGFQTGTFAYWREEGFVRRFSETIQFLHTQAVADQMTYVLELDIPKRSYWVGVLAEEANDGSGIDISDEVGMLSLELSLLRNPPYVTGETFSPPPSFPSLGDLQFFPNGIQINKVRTMRGVAENSGKAFISFSPRGFSEFAAIQVTLSNGAPVTFLVNPFTGIVDIYREHKDFEWTYGKKNEDS